MKSSLINIFLLVAVLLFSWQLSFAHTKPPIGRISGIVTDSTSNQPIGFATISLKTEKDSLIKVVVSKADGHFRFENVDVRRYHLTIASTGYLAKTTTIDLTQSHIAELGTLLLSRQVKNLKEVQITADRPVVQLKADRVVYDLQADPESKSTNVLGMIHKIPYLSVDADGNILMKGNPSYKVLVNGKESGVFTNNLKNILKSMPASSVLRIEVITIPPSKYDAEGLTGIINIITDRKIQGGYKGNLNVNEGFPNSGPGAGGNITAQDGKFGVNAWAGGSKYTNPSTNFSTTRTTSGTDASVLQQGGHKNANGGNVYFGTELSYEIDTLNLLTANFDISGYRYNAFSNQNSALNDPTGALLQGYNLATTNHNHGGGFDAALNYQLGFKSDKNTLLTFSYRYSDYQSTAFANVDISDPFKYPTPDYQQPDNEFTREQTVQVDFAHPLHKVTMEAGIKAIFRNSKSDFEYLSLDSATNQFLNDPAMGDNFNYIQNVFGAYNSYRFSIKKWNFSAGLRGEETYVNANFVSTGTSVDKTYFNVVPSIAINHPFADNSGINLGFMERIRRPIINRLNPFVDRSNPNFVSTGNPNLKPTVLNNIQIGYNSPGGKKLSCFISASYVFFNSLELPVTTFDPATQITTITYEDNAKGGGIDFNFNLNYSPVKFYNVSLNSNMTQFMVNGKGNITEDRIHTLAGHISLSNGFKLDKGWSANLNIDYQTRAPRSIQDMANAYFSTSLSVNKELVKNKLYVSGAVNNPFTKFRNSIVTTTSPDYYQVNDNQVYFRYISFSLNYNFGKLKSDIKKNRKGIQNDDTGGGGL
jgi:outer membrane receptor protein involved in Fe transport